MGKTKGHAEVFQTSPLMILLSYTILGGGLIAETIVMSWELWAIPLLLAGIIISWGLHVTQFLSVRVRIWICTLLMMASFFFYGIHVTSTFDIGLLMMMVIMVFTTTGEIGIIYVCQLTYYLTIAYDVAVMTADNATTWDSLMISRLILHLALIFVAGSLARTIIKRWGAIFGKAGEQIAELNESTKRMNSFMANLSHELRTPINAILGITNVMLDGEKDRQQRRNMAEVILAGNRLADQVGDILDYSEIEMDSLVVNAGKYVIASVLNDLVAELRPMMPDHLELIIDVDAEVPAVMKGDALKLRRILYHLINNGLKYSKEGGVYVNISAIRQTYGVNLCVEVTDTGIGMTKEELDRIYNRFYQARSGRVVRSGGLGISMVIVSGFVRVLGGFMTIDSRPGEGTTVRVSIPQEVVDDGRCMMVSDSSRITLGAYLNIEKYKNPNVREFYNKMIMNIVCGLKMTMHRVDNVEDLRKLMEKVDLTHLFIAEEEYKENLEYVESLAKRMQVVVVARESFELPKGSQAQIMPKPFYCIPVVTVLNSERGKEKRDEGKMRCDGVRALVVDDEPMNLSVAKGIFKRYGMIVKTANSGEEAIRLCREEEFDVVFMDHMMPGMDGVEAMKRIRREVGSNKRNYVIIALTANALSAAREMFLAEGFDGFVSKPIELVELERVLKKVLPESRISFEHEEEDQLTTAQDTAEAQKEAEAIEVTETLKAAGIDVSEGLKYCEQDEELYDSLLRQFVEEAKEKRDKLEKFLKAGDAKNYGILVHALKSTALMIGASDLSRKAKALETAAKDNDVAFMEERHGEAMMQYQAITEAIAKTKHFDRERNEEVFEFYPGE